MSILAPSPDGCRDGSGVQLGTAEQARRPDPLEVDLGADRGRGGPEGHQVGQGGVRRHEVLTPGVAVRLDVRPEVALLALRPVDHLGRQVSELDALRDRLVDEVADLEEDAAVALGLDDLLGIVDRGCVRQEAGADEVADEEVDVDGTEVEGVVLRVGHGVDDAVHVGPDHLQVEDGGTEVHARLVEPGTTHPEVRLTRELDEPLDGHVAEHQLRHGLGQRLSGGDGVNQADLVRGLVVDSSQEETSLFVVWYLGFPFQ